MWDDHVYEPISALLDPNSGLLTPNSFHRQNGVAVTYPNVDAVAVVRQLHQFKAAAAEDPLFDGRSSALEYGESGFPYKVVVPESAFARVPPRVVECLQLLALDPLMGAEDNVQDVVMWLDI